MILFWIMSAKREYVSFHSVSFQMSLVLACKRFCEFFFMVFAIHKNLICWIQFQYILLHHYATYLLFILLLFLLLADGSCANLSGFPDSGVCLQGRRLSHEIQTCKFRPWKCCRYQILRVSRSTFIHIHITYKSVNLIHYVRCCCTFDCCDLYWTTLASDRCQVKGCELKQYNRSLIGISWPVFISPLT